MHALHPTEKNREQHAGCIAGVSRLQGVYSTLSSAAVGAAAVLARAAALAASRAACLASSCKYSISLLRLFDARVCQPQYHQGREGNPAKFSKAGRAPAPCVPGGVPWRGAPLRMVPALLAAATAPSPPLPPERLLHKDPNIILNTHSSLECRDNLSNPWSLCMLPVAWRA